MSSVFLADLLSCYDPVYSNWLIKVFPAFYYSNQGIYSYTIGLCDLDISERYNPLVVISWTGFFGKYAKFVFLLLNETFK